MRSDKDMLIATALQKWVQGLILGALIILITCSCTNTISPEDLSGVLVVELHAAGSGPVQLNVTLLDGVSDGSLELINDLWFVPARDGSAVLIKELPYQGVWDKVTWTVLSESAGTSYTCVSGLPNRLIISCSHWEVKPWP
jgi:hypothetical protein